MRHAYAVRRRVLNPYLVRQRDRRRVRELLVVLAAALALGLCLLAYVRLQVELIRTGYQVERLEGDLERAARVERQLTLDAGFLERPKRIEVRAIEELGMAPPAVDQLLVEEDLR